MVCDFLLELNINPSFISVNREIKEIHIKFGTTTASQLQAMPITNDTITAYTFLKEMSQDAYFPDFLVTKGQQILLRLCEQIELTAPQDAVQLCQLTHAATQEFNALGEEFEDNGSELETAARDCIGTDFEFIAKAYGFEVDVEELIATREW
jgi:hypothetical protein